MRRPWLLLALLAPAVAFPQTAPTPNAGQITWPAVPHTDLDGNINIAECASGSIELDWVTSITAAGQTPTGYRAYASDTAPTGDCYTSDTTVNGTAIKAGPIHDLIASTSTTIVKATFDTSSIASVAGKACNSSSNGNAVYLCIQAVNNGSNVGVSRLGSDGAPAKLTINFDRPPQPVNLSARPGEQAANVSWGAGGALSDSYRVDATPIGTTAVPSRSSPRIAETSYRLGGLVNDQPYTITVTAFSVAGNPNLDPSPTTSVTPSHVLDFFAEYKDGGGRELGGCAGGPAGPVALVAAAAALLALQRRRK